MPGMGFVDRIRSDHVKKSRETGIAFVRMCRRRVLFRRLFFALWHLHSFMNDDGRAYSIREEAE